MANRRRLKSQNGGASKEIELMLDSGAFSAFTRGQEIDVDAYIRYVKQHRWGIDQIVNVDVIPGRSGKTPSQTEVNEAAEQTYKNLKYMERHGLHPLPVFHFGEDYYYLDRLLDEGYTYIALGGLARGKSPDARRNWLDRTWTRLTTPDGWPIVDVHGFGITAVPILFRYPWASCDSTAWMLTPAYGGIFVPREKNGQFDFTQTPEIVKLSSKSPTLTEGKHFDNLGKRVREQVLKYIHSEGHDLEELRASWVPRTVMAVRYLKSVEQSLDKFPFRHRVRGFFT